MQAASQTARDFWEYLGAQATLTACASNDGLWRFLPVPARSGGGRLTERIPAVQPRRRERVKVPHSRPCRSVSALPQLDCESTFAEASLNGQVMP